jgi:hypothetical protein
MADSSLYAQTYLGQIKVLADCLDQLRLLNDRYTADPTVLDAYLASAAKRADLDSTKFAAARSSVAQLLFTYDSGNPTQKAGIYGLL